MEVLDSILHYLANAETFHLTYLLSGNDKDLQAYYGEMSGLIEIHQSLTLLFIDKPIQLHRLASMKELIDEKFARIEESVSLHNVSRLEAAKNAVDCDRCNALTKAIINLQEEMADTEHVLLSQKQKEISTVVSVNSIIIVSGSILALVIIAIVISLISSSYLREKSLSRELWETGELLHSIVDTAVDGIVTIDDTGIIQSFNSGAERIFDYMAAEVIGNSLNMLIPDPIKDSHEQYVINYLHTGHNKTMESYSHEINALRRDGSLVPILVSLARMQVKGKTWSSAIIHDITKQKANEEHLQTLSERLRLATSSAEIGIWDWDLVEDLLVWDDTMYRLFGVAPEDFSGAYDAWQKCVHPEDLPAADAAVQAAIIGERDLDTDFRVVWPNGEIRIIKADAVVQRDESDGATHMIGINWDISILKQAVEEQKQAREEAEKANSAKSDFLANMSHEIRTPINAIIGLNRLLNNSLLSEKQKDYSSKINMASHNLLAIINDILDFSKIEAGMLIMESIEFDIDSILKSLGNISFQKSRDRGLEIIYDMDPDIPSFLVGDPGRLEQILLNLISNAIKFTHDGYIIISSQLIKKADKEVTLKFSVKDSGIGLSDENQAKLFQTYTQADTSTTREYGGTGLGLSISRKLVQMMGGKIGIKSKEGKGSTFFFTARFGYKAEEERAFLQPPVDLKGLRILVVDDIRDIRNIEREQLERFGFTVTTVSSSSRAINELHNALVSGKRYYDMVIIDSREKGIDGIKASKLIKNDPEIVQKPKIILTSTYISEETLNRQDKPYVSGLLSKPYSSSELLNTILNVFGKEFQPDHLTSSFNDRLPDGFENIKGARILLAEDNEINQMIATESLENAGFWVSIANDGLEAVEKVMESREGIPFDAVLMDLQMPVMDGFQAAREIRKEKNFTDLPIIALTADVVGDVKQRCLDAGMDNFVTKPFELSKLYSSLIECIKPAEREVFISESEHHRCTREAFEGHLSNLHGIDVVSGLHHVHQNYELYLKLLLRFKTKYSTFITEIGQSLAANDTELSTRLAHTLKGVAGNLGAEELYKAARGLEAAAKENDVEEIDKHLENTDKILREVLDSITEFEEVNREILSPEEERFMKPEEIVSELKKAEKLLSEYDADTVGIIERLGPSLISCGYKVETDTLFVRMSDYDFEGSLEIVERIIKSMEENNG